MKNLVVGPGGAPLVDTASSTVVGRRVAAPVRLVSALPVLGGELEPLVAIRGIARGGARSVAVVAGRDRVYVSRMVWATPE